MLGCERLGQGRIFNFNLGTMFGRNDLEEGRDALRVIAEADERLRHLRALGHGNPRLTSNYQKIMWDQAVVNDAFESYQVCAPTAMLGM